MIDDPPRISFPVRRNKVQPACHMIGQASSRAGIWCTTVLLACGPAWAQSTPQPKGRIATVKVEQAGRGEVARLVGSLTFERKETAVHAVLAVKNDCDTAIWVPRSPEATNFTVDGLPNTHVDFALCAFPADYLLLKPGEMHRYIQRLPKGAKGQIEMQVWAPWRAPDGKALVDTQTLKAALKPNELLVEEIVGVGQLD